MTNLVPGGRLPGASTNFHLEEGTMKKILAFVLAALIATAGVASAQVVFPSGNGVSNPTNTGGPIVVYPPGAYNFKQRNLTGSALIRQGRVTFYGMQVYNGTGATVYVQVFNALGPGSVTLGTTTPDFEFPCTTLAFCTSQLYLPAGIAFVSGLVVGATTTEGGGTPIGNGLEAWVQFQ